MPADKHIRIGCPKVYLEDGVAKNLFNGVSPDSEPGNDGVFTFVQEIE